MTSKFEQNDLYIYSTYLLFMTVQNDIEENVMRAKCNLNIPLFHEIQ